MSLARPVNWLVSPVSRPSSNLESSSESYNVHEPGKETQSRRFFFQDAAVQTQDPPLPPPLPVITVTPLLPFYQDVSNLRNDLFRIVQRSTIYSMQGFQSKADREQVSALLSLLTGSLDILRASLEWDSHVVRPSFGSVLQFLLILFIRSAHNLRSIMVDI